MERACRRTGEWLEERREGHLDAAGVAQLDAHLRDCAGCRAEAGATAPLTLFRDLTGGEAPDDVRSYILGGLRVAGTRPERRRLWPSVLSATLWEPAPALAALLLVGVLLVAWASGGGSTPLTPVEPWLREGSMTNAVAAVEEIRSPTAEVFAFSLDDASGATEVILIVDRSIDL